MNMSQTDSIIYAYCNAANAEHSGGGERSMKDNETGCWIDESTRKEIVSLLREARDHIRLRPDNGAAAGNIGQIEAVLSKLALR